MTTPNFEELHEAFVVIENYCNSHSECLDDCPLRDICTFITVYQNMASLAYDARGYIDQHMEYLMRKEAAE